MAWRSKPGEYHRREFESLRTNFNSYPPTFLELVRGIKDNQAKWDYHLRRLEELRVVVHTNLVFGAVPYTRESSKRILRSANSNFSTVVMYSAKHYDTNDPGYGLRPFAMEVWDFPTNMQRWSRFFEAENHR